MLTDAHRWDIIHQKTQKDQEGHSAYAEEKEREFPRSALICDLGGGTGADAFYFLKKGHSVILFDISKYALDSALTRIKASGLEKNLVTKQVDFGLETIPLKKDSVDIVYSRIALHYFPFSETRAIFKTIHEALKVGGQVFVTFKSPEDEAEMEYLKVSAVEYEPGVYIENGQLRSRFTIDQLKKLLEGAGISNYEINPYKELLGTDASGTPQVLLLYEITFTK